MPTATASISAEQAITSYRNRPQMKKAIMAPMTINARDCSAVMQYLDLA